MLDQSPKAMARQERERRVARELADFAAQLLAEDPALDVLSIRIAFAHAVDWLGVTHPHRLDHDRRAARPAA